MTLEELNAQLEEQRAVLNKYLALDHRVTREISALMIRINETKHLIYLAELRQQIINGDVELFRNFDLDNRARKLANMDGDHVGRAERVMEELEHED